MTNTQRCIIITILGAPNAGKSTLVNALTGSKISIVSPKVQTTRTRVTGITMEGNAQLVCVDTPGIFTPQKRLDRAMVKAAWSNLHDSDMLLLMVDAVKGITEDTALIMEELRARHSLPPILLLLNKIDAVKPQKLLPLVKTLNEQLPFAETFMISSLNGDGVADVRQYLAAHAPEGPWLYPPDQLSDMPLRLFAAEITREKLFLALAQELPYALMVETEQWEEHEPDKKHPKGSVTIRQVIFTGREGHKKIIIGKKGSTIKSVGEAARRELEVLLDKKVHLFLFVKVKENWQDTSEHYQALGLDFS